MCCMDTAFGRSLSSQQIREQVGSFYDLGSPYYLDLWGQHIHDGYYITGRESNEEAQVNLTKRLAEKAGIMRRATVLDVGCGIGGSSIWLAEELGAITTGITISAVQVEIARRLARERRATSSFLLMDAEKMEFEQAFDVIWAVAMITHIKQQENVLGRATRFLNNGGKFVLFDWMLAEGNSAAAGNTQIDLISRGMLLASLHPMSFYLEWFVANGYRITYTEDMTAHTGKTWKDALSLMKLPSVWKLVYHASREERRKILPFLRSLRPMKQAMQGGRLISAAVIAEKI